MPQKLKANVRAAAPADPAPPEPKHWTSSLLVPLIAFLAAGLSKLVDWDMPPTAILLLVGYGTVALVLSRMRHDSMNWRADPGTHLWSLKQMIAITRVVLTLVLILFITLLLATSRTLTNRLPGEMAATVEGLVANPDSRDAIVVKLAEPLRGRDGLSVYFGSVDKSGATVTTAPEPFLQAQPLAPVPGQQLYVIAAPSVLKRLVDLTIVPTFYSIATLILILCLLFTGVVFGMEVFGGVQLEIRGREEQQLG